MKPRALLKPFVWQPEDPTKVFVHIPVSGPHDYFEMVLTPEEARSFAIDLLNDSERALHMIAVNARLAKR